MLYFPHCKINIGLNITHKREDGFHDIETIFYPVGMQDVLEFVEADDFKFTLTGVELDGEPMDNLVVKAYRMLEEKYPLKPLHVHLHKAIPSGAGLGGGSADASFMLSALNSHFKLGISDTELMDYALQLGSDCPFFIQPVPCVATGRGEKMQAIALNLSGYELAVVKPAIHVSTAKAYAQMKPKPSQKSLAELVKLPMEEWKAHIHNQFEDYVFSAHPEVKAIKEKLYQQGAEFALMSGSGSAVYGLFKQKPELAEIFPSNYHIFYQKL